MQGVMSAAVGIFHKPWPLLVSAPPSAALLPSWSIYWTLCRSLLLAWAPVALIAAPCCPPHLGVLSTQLLHAEASHLCAVKLIGIVYFYYMGLCA